MNSNRQRSMQYYESESGQAYVGTGCLSGFILPPLAALVIGLCMTLFLSSVVMVPEVPAAQMGGVQAAIVPPAADPASASQQEPPPPAQQGGIAPLFTPEVQYWAEDIVRWARKMELDPNMVATVMQIESCGDPRAVSHAGAMGLFQVMPFHFKGDDQPYNPDTNAYRGTAYLRLSLQKADGNARLAFAGYNGGTSVIKRAESTWASETRRYAYWGSGIYSDAARESDHSERLQEWLNAGGASLCRQASKRLGINP